MRRRLLVVDGNSFTHRAYHGLPKTMRRRGDKGGFASFLLRLYEDERSRAVLVGWDTLEAPTYRMTRSLITRMGVTSMLSCANNSRSCRSS